MKDKWPLQSMQQAVLGFVVFVFLNACAAVALAQDSMVFSLQTRCDAKPMALPSADTHCWLPPTELGQGDVWLAQGKIERKTEEVLGEAAKRMAPGTIIVLNSLGGDLVGGLRLGQALRARHLFTWVVNPQAFGVTLTDSKSAGKCFSSCAYAFMGGVQRQVDKSAMFGVHQFRQLEDKLDAVQAQKISALLARYLDAMGIHRQLLDQAMLTEPGKMSLINEGQRAAWNVVTSSPRAYAASRWKLEAAAGGKRLTYSTVRQSQRDCSLTFALTYMGGQLRALVIAKPDARDELSPDWLNAFNDRTELTIEINGNQIQLQPISDWQVAGQVNTAGTRQIWYQMKPDLSKEFMQVKQFKLKPNWTVPPIGMDAESVFSTDGFKDNFAAL